jgi:hypothetical protein
MSATIYVRIVSLVKRRVSMAEMVGGRYERAFAARASIGESKHPNSLQKLAS